MEKGDKQKKKTGAGKVRTKLRVEDDVSLSNTKKIGLIFLIITFNCRTTMHQERIWVEELMKTKIMMILCESNIL